MKLTARRNQCAGCKQYFNSNRAFDEHRVGPFGTGPMGTSPDRRCLTTEEMTQDAHFQLQATGFWTFSAKPGDRPRHWTKVG